MNYDSLFQADLIKALAADPDFFLTTKLKITDFDDPDLRIVFGTMMRHKEVFNEAPAAGSFSNEVIDEIQAVMNGEDSAIVQELTDSQAKTAAELADAIVEILKNPDKSGTKYWRSKLPGFIAQQRARRQIDGTMPLLDQVNVARRIADEAEAAGSAGGIQIKMDEDYDVDAEFAETEGLAKGVRIGTGIWPIDRRMGGGGLVKGQIGAIMAPTGVGKSTIMTNIAANMAINGYYSLFLSLEDKPETVRNRYAAIVGNFDATCMQDPKPKWPEEIKEEYRRIYSRDSPVYNMFTPLDGTDHKPTCAEIEATIKQWRQMLYDRGVPEDRIVGVFVDYVKRVSHQGLDLPRNPQLYQMYGAIMEELTRVAARQNVILWTAMQANREATKRNDVDKTGASDSFDALQPCFAAFSVVVPKKPGEVDSSTMGQEYDKRSSASKPLTRCDRKLRFRIVKMREAATEDQVFYVYQGPSLRVWTNDQEARDAESWKRANDREKMYAAMRR